MLSDLRHALRSLARTPGFTLIALLTLALGIGANTSMFSVLNALLLHTPAYPAPDELIRVYRTDPRIELGPHSPANFTDFQAQAKSFAHLAAYTGDSNNLAMPGLPAEQLPGLSVSGDFFAVFGVAPALGRFITAGDDQPGHGNVVVLSDTVWRNRFNADPAILNRQLRLNGQPVTVIGVMPAGFDDRLVWGEASVWRPLALDTENRQSRGGNWLSLVGRLRPGVTTDQASAEMNAIGANLARAYPATEARTSLTLMPFVRSTQDGTARELSLFAMGLAACVLLIACVNLANLLFARNALRAREHAIRAALGASRLRLIRASLTESLALALAGGGLGLLVALWCNAALSAHLRIGGQTGFALPLDGRVIGFSFTVATLTGIAFGLLPALLSSRTDVNTALKRGARGATAGGHPRLRHSLIVAEVALALVLLSGAGFFIRGLDRFLARDQGWRTDSLLTARLALSSAKYSGAATVAFYDRLQARLSALPGVQHVALARTLPLRSFSWGQRFIVEGQPVPKPGSEPMRDVNGVSPDYFAAMGLPLIEGRTFTATDITGPTRTLISESMARQLWPGESAVGKRIAHPTGKEWHEIIGVVRDVSFPTNLDNARPRFQTYRLLAREPDNYVSVIIRSTTPPETLADAVRRTVGELDPEEPVQSLLPAVEVIRRDLSNYAVIGWLLTGFALLGLLLAAVGIFGVISGFVTQRTSEIGLRMALGAQVRDMLAMILAQGLRLTLVGVTLGLAGAFAVARLLASAVPALPSAEPITACVVALTLVATAALACYLPARRAAKVDPMVALRAE